MSTNASGKFIVNLELNNNYVIIFSKNGNISKTVEIDTKVPEEVKTRSIPTNSKLIFSRKLKELLSRKVFLNRLQNLDTVKLSMISIMTQIIPVPENRNWKR